MKKKPTTRMHFILQIFCNNPESTFSCQQITNKIIKKQKLTGSIAHYLSGSITTILAGLVKKGTLKYADTKTTRGGHLYQLDLNNAKIKTTNPI